MPIAQPALLHVADFFALGSSYYGKRKRKTQTKTASAENREKRKRKFQNLYLQLTTTVVIVSLVTANKLMKIPCGKQTPIYFCRICPISFQTENTNLGIANGEKLVGDFVLIITVLT